MTSSPPDAVVAFLLRRGDAAWREHAAAFLASYEAFDAGRSHRLLVILKDFENAGDEAEAHARLAGARYDALVVPEAGRDIGAYMAVARHLGDERVCFLNSHARVLCPGWLRQLDRHLDRPEVGMVGATASFESLRALDPAFPGFPNPHLRTNAFMVAAPLFREITADLPMVTRQDAFMFESGALSMTNRVLAAGRQVVVAGRNGRAYPVDWWPWSGGFRQGLQENLLVGDNQTRHFDRLPWPERVLLANATWGEFRSRTSPPPRT
ncbi:hypothetical protein [Caulobacter endophyticus]|uniref:hypothetical protein n=1 Tax=Caulobacter endophyticus TaxID=2172652 RepID=UPI00240F5B9B|nr:hypothetical protein [Caulobacter endophyticus]MDG2528806.1 hypothetical protein [Caulobacter endophyticus]